MTAVVLAGTDRVEELIILFYQIFAPVRVLPDPVAESFFNCLLLLLGERGFLLVQHPLFFSFSILYCVVDADIPKIQCIFEYSISICAVSSVCHICRNIICRHQAFPINEPFRSICREVYLD